MIAVTLDRLATDQCRISRPAMSRDGYIKDAFGVSRQFFSKVAQGKKKPSAKLLRGMANAHTRLFPNETILVEIPNHPTIILGDPKNLSPSAK